MNQLIEVLTLLWQLVWGKPYYRFCALLLTIGAGLAAGPSFWELVLEFLVQMFGVIYASPATEVTINIGSAIGTQLVGCAVMLASVLLFVPLFLRDQKEAGKEKASIFVRDLEDLKHLRRIWTHMRDIYAPPNPVNQDDLAKALFGVNEAGRLCLEHAALRREFASSSFGHDYCTLYNKLVAHNYVLNHMPGVVRDYICPEAHELAGLLGCDNGCQ